MVDQKLIVVRAGYERVLNDFLKKMQAQRHEKIAETGDSSFTEFEALMPDLVCFLLPEKKCRIVLEYDPAESRVELRREVSEVTQGVQS